MANRDSFDDFDTEEEDGFLTFDARDEEENQSRGPLIIAAIVAALAICGLILWQLYQGGGNKGATPQIAADPGAYKAPPVNAEGELATDLDKGVFDAADGSGAPALDVLPAPSSTDDPLLADGAAVPAQTKPAPAKTNVPPPIVTPKPQPVAKAPQTQVAQAKSPPPVSAEKPKPVPTTTPAVKVAEVTPPAPRPVPVKAEPVATAEPKAAPGAASSTSTGISAQLGSFQDRAAAESALAKYRATGLSGPVSVVAANLGAKGTWYRIRATGFETRSEVDGFCAKARSAGAQCIPAGR